MVCTVNKPYYIPQNQSGIRLVNSLGDANNIEIYWYSAYVDNLNFNLAYNIYFSTEEENVFLEGPKFLSTNLNGLYTKISGFTPGDTYYFAVRATEYQSIWYNPNFLPDAEDGYMLKVYPETLLAANISNSSTIIPITDIDLFPPMGVIQVGYEYIRYDSKDIPNSTLLVAERGFLNTNIRSHTIDGYDGYDQLSPIVRFFQGCEEVNTLINEEASNFNYNNFAYTLADGYKEETKDLLTTDLSFTEAQQIDFPVYPQEGWRRTDLDAFFKGQCLDTYFGGESGCADGYNVGNQIRNVSISDINDQRQEFILNFTGEPVVLVKRLWKGIRCSCYEPNKESAESRCPNCFVPGTLVNTELGWRPIEDIKIGERVLSSDGYYHKVLRTFKNDYNGELLSIQSSVSSQPILTTPEHPFLVMRGKHQSLISKPCDSSCDTYINNGDGDGNQRPHNVQILPSGNWWARVHTVEGKRITLGSHKTKEDAVNAIINYKKENYKLGHNLDWDEAENINKYDWLVSKWNSEIKDVDIINIPQEFLKNTKLGLQRNGVDKFELNEEFLWIIGIYIAEGSCSKRSLNFALHKEETVFQNRIITFFQKLGYNAKLITSSENGVCVVVNSTTLALWFPKWLGHLCYNKRIPQELMQLPVEKTWALIKGIYDGDGSKSDHEIGQTSRILALQLTELLHRVGEQPLIRRQRSKVLTPKGNVRKLCYIVSWAEDTLKNSNRKCRWNFKGEILARVNEVEKIQYNGPVYNLEIEDDHSYIVEGIIVHNCHGTSFITGFEQFYNPRRSDGRIMVRFGPYTDDVKQEDSGLESIAIHDCRALTTPVIKDRDFIIRFNEDGTEEYRYEVLDVTRNKIFYGVSGVQNFKAQRIRKTDPIYSWRAIRSTATMPNKVNTSVGLLLGPNNTFIPHTHQIVLNENITALSQVNQTTSMSNGHNHPIINGVIQSSPIDGHTHQIINF